MISTDFWKSGIRANRELRRLSKTATLIAQWKTCIKNLIWPTAPATFYAHCIYTLLILYTHTCTLPNRKYNPDNCDWPSRSLISTLYFSSNLSKCWWQHVHVQRSLYYLCAFACVKCGGPTTTWTYRMNHHQTAYIFKCYMKLINVMEFNHENCNYSWFTIYGLIRPFYIQISVCIQTYMHAVYIRINQHAYETGLRAKKGYDYGNSKSETNLYNVAYPHRTYPKHRVLCHIRVSVCMWNICWHRYNLIGKLFCLVLFYFIEHLFVCVRIFSTGYIQCCKWIELCCTGDTCITYIYIYIV